MPIKRKLYSSVVKNIVRVSNLLSDASAVVVAVIAVATDDWTVGTTNQVSTGKYVQAINFEINFNFEGNITAIYDWYIWKNENQAVRTSPALTGLVADDTRRLRLLEGMEMPAGINNSSAIKRIGTVLIPKHMQRLGKNEQWEFVYVASVAGNVSDVCAKFIYKVKEPV